MSSIYKKSNVFLENHTYKIMRAHPYDGESGLSVGSLVVTTGKTLDLDGDGKSLVEVRGHLIGLPPESLGKPKHSEIIFPIGSKVLVLSDYQSMGGAHRATVATVIGHQVNPGSDFEMDPFTDNLLQFENGEVEPFGNWEIKNA